MKAILAVDARTDATVLFQLVCEAMRRAELPIEEVFAKMGIHYSAVEKASRTPLSAQIAFWSAVEEITQDHDIGLHLGEHLPLYRGQILEHLFLSSPTFGDGLRRMLSYQRLISDGLDASLVLEQDGQLCYIVNRAEYGRHVESLRHYTECMIMGVLRFFKSVTEGAFNFLHIELDYAHGASVHEYQRVYGCQVSLNCRQLRLYFDAHILSYKLWQPDPDLLRMHEQLASVKLKELAQIDLISEIRRSIAANLDSSEVTLASVSHDLGIEVRKLRSLLSEAGTSFQQVLTEYRCRLAKKLLSETNENIEKIVYLTGFSGAQYNFTGLFDAGVVRRPLNIVGVKSINR